MDGFNGYGNRNTVGVEICRNYDRTRKTTNLNDPLRTYYSNAELNAIKVVAQLCVDLGIKASADTIKRHYDWSGKWCPSKILNEGRWIAVQTAIIAEYIRLTTDVPAKPVAPVVTEPVKEVDKTQGTKPTTKPVTVSPVKQSGIQFIEVEEGSFRAGYDILVRDKPSISGKHVATYYKGEVLDKYIRYHAGNGYIWLEYNRSNGTKGYLPIREYNNGQYGEMWGDIGDVGAFAKKATPAPTPAKPALKSLDIIAKEVIDGKWGNSPEREKKLKAAGYDASKVQAKVNELAKPKVAAKPVLKSTDVIAKEVIDGKWGSGTDRVNKLTKAGYNPTTIQNRVNQLLQPASSLKSIDVIAKEVIDGKWSNGADREKKLKAAGYDPAKVQAKVNQLLS